MNKIAVFDSGLGGITVLSELKKAMPSENFIYYGDSAHAPYGDRTNEELISLCTGLCNNILKRDSIKCFVAACNTTTARVLGDIRARFPEHSFIGIEPAVKKASENEKGAHILVLATTATAGSEALKRRVSECSSDADISILAAPGIVPYVEGFMPDRENFIHYLKDLLKDYRDTTDAVVLGCTHYPFVKEELRLCFKKDVRFYDAARDVAAKVKCLLLDKGALVTEGSGSIEFLNSDTSKISLEERLLDEYQQY